MKREVKLFISFSFLLFLLFEPSCVDLPTEFKLPNWDVDLNLPIVNRTYTLSDIIKTQDYISVQGTSSADSIYVIQSDSYSQEVGIENFIQVTSPSSTKGNFIPVGNMPEDTVYLPFPEGAQIISAKFVGGSFAFHIKNPTAAMVNLTLTFPGILRQDGTPFVVQRNVPAFADDSSKYNFAGYSYQMPANQATQYQSSIQIKVKAVSTLQLSYVTIDFYSSDFYFSTVTGNLPSKSLGYKTQSFDLNIGNVQDYRDKAYLKQAKLNLSVQYISPSSNPFGIEVKNLNIIGTREDGTQFMLKDSTGNPNLLFKLKNGSFNYTFTEKNSNVNSFVSFLPSKVVLNAEYIMNPDNRVGTATVQDSVKFVSDFSTTSIMALKKSTIVDTSDMGDISQQDRNKIKDAKTAYLTVNIQNGIPLAMWLKVTFLDSLFHPLVSVNNSSNNSDSIYFSPANIDQNGEVSSATLSSATIQLNSDQTVKLSHAYHVVYSVSVQSNGADQSSPPKVAIRPNDQIKVQVYGGVKFLVNQDDLKGDNQK